MPVTWIPLLRPYVSCATAPKPMRRAHLPNEYSPVQQFRGWCRFCASGVANTRAVCGEREARDPFHMAARARLALALQAPFHLSPQTRRAALRRTDGASIAVCPPLPNALESF